MGSMEQEHGGDLVISGSGSVGGGVYKLVKISGSGKVGGDVECEEMKVSGAGKLDGNVKTGNAKISGSSTVGGSLRAETLEVSGSSEIDDDLAASSLHVSGSMKAAKNLSGDDVRFKGSIKVAENCAADTFRATGSFKIGGLLNADNIDIELYGESSVKEIGGEQIQVQKKDKIFPFNLVHSFRSPKLSVDVIEGDHIHLESTEAKVVRGSDIHIGPDCHIDLVEYKNDFQQNGNARVKGSKKI